MTSAAPPVGAAAVSDRPAPSPVTAFSRLLLSEWTKIRSVRSTVWSLILLVIVTLGFTGLFTWLTILQWDKTDPTQRAQIMADPQLKVTTVTG